MTMIMMMMMAAAPAGGLFGALCFQDWLHDRPRRGRARGGDAD